MKTIRVLVDADPAVQNEDDSVKQSRTTLSSLVAKVKQSAIEINTEALSNGLQEIYTGLVEAVTSLQALNNEVEIDNIQFSIGIDSSGQVSLLSTVSASTQFKTGISFTVRFKKQ